MEAKPVIDIKTHFGLPVNFKLNKFTPKQFVCGCEFEIESILNWENLGGFVSVEEDHSLRNNGKEFKTPPVGFELALETFRILHDNIKLGPNPFSERTSIHVHVNVRDLSLKDVRNLILTYALLEPLFFEFAGETRKGSIFCVPLSYTYLPSLYKHPITMLLDKWKNNKYTAFNLLPITSFGTVEFRHLYGTGDEQVFTTWLTAIKELYDYVVNHPELEVTELLKEPIAKVALEIIPSLAKLYSVNRITELTQDSVVDIKLSKGGLK
jgi:hypothetical protein